MSYLVDLARSRALRTCPSDHCNMSALIAEKYSIRAASGRMGQVSINSYHLS